MALNMMIKNVAVLALFCLAAGACGRPVLPEDPRADVYYDCKDHLGSEFRLLQGALSGQTTSAAYRAFSQRFEAYREEACLCLEESPRTGQVGRMASQPAVSRACWTLWRMRGQGASERLRAVSSQKALAL